MPSIDALRADVRSIFDAALHAVEGESKVFETLQQASLPDSVALIAVGKAAVSMSRGATRALGDRIARALVVTKHGYQGKLAWPVETAGHPVPDEASLAAGAHLNRFIAELPPDQAVLVLLSGGASSLVEMLPPGLTLNDLRALNQWLLGSGLDIASANRVRARVSLLKGGRLAQLLAPRPVLCLAISDVPDDEPAWIGSGPLTALPSPGAVPGAAPDFVRVMLEHAPPGPTASDPCFQHVRYRIVARSGDAVSAAAAAASALGYDAAPGSMLLQGDALEQGAILARELLAEPAGCVRIRGGETTVHLPASPGRGGRNQSLALAAAQVLEGAADCVLLSAGTDGSDGPGTDAGALVDNATLARGRAAGLDAEDALRRADAGTFLAASGDLFATGPTGTNVMDLCIGLRL